MILKEITPTRTVYPTRVPIEKLRLMLQSGERIALRLMARTRALRAAIYRLLFGHRYSREMRTVAAGRIRYLTVQAEQTNDLRSDPILRRCIHRLEKGLTMRPRSPVFALDYIAETIDCLDAALRRADHSKDELQWAIDVLAAYFLAVDEVGAIQAARRRFNQLLKTEIASRSIRADPNGMSPKDHDETTRADVSFDQLLTLFRQRKSVRWFTQTPVPPELLHKAISAARHAPSACNRQPFLFRVIMGNTDTARVAAIAMGTAGYSHQIPALIVVIGDFSAFEVERDRHLPYIDGSLASMQLMLACETLGLGTCPINWPDIEARERKMSIELDLPAHLRPIMLIAVGYPDPAGKVAFSTKKSAHDLLS